MYGTQVSAGPALPLEGRVAPPGLKGRSRAGEGVAFHGNSGFSANRTTPHPNPPPEGGREPTVPATSTPHDH
jgi:hypothetical protein